jgi:L-alanine-DL-glutamate epimerase-like enolase superfamily enzyme
VRIRGAGVTYGYGAGKSRPFLKIGMRDERGTLGIGEASPLAGFSPDRLDNVHACAMSLVEMCADLGPIEDEAPPAEAVTAAMSPIDAALAAMPSARFAMEMALFDLVGQQRGLSVAECLAGPGRPEGFPINALLDASTDDLAARGRALAEQGFEAIKVKLRARDAAGFSREKSQLLAMRRVLPPPFEVRLDPNGAWTVDEARRNMASLAEIEPRFVEQPVPPEALLELGKTAVPWAADESLRIPGMPERLAQAPGCAAFVLKPMVLGGFFASLRIAALAAEAGRDLVVTHLFDGPVAMAAACELARALPRAPIASGLALHSQLAGYPALSIPQLTRPERAAAARLPGLGFSVEERERWIRD